VSTESISMERLEQLERIIAEIVAPMEVDFCRPFLGRCRVVQLPGRDEVCAQLSTRGNFIGAKLRLLSGDQVRGDPSHWSGIVLEQVNAARRKWAGEMRSLAARMEPNA